MVGNYDGAEDTFFTSVAVVSGNKVNLITMRRHYITIMKGVVSKRQ
jgi:hypothetical protein